MASRFITESEIKKEYKGYYNKYRSDFKFPKPGLMGAFNRKQVELFFRHATLESAENIAAYLGFAKQTSLTPWLVRNGVVGIGGKVNVRYSIIDVKKAQKIIEDRKKKIAAQRVDSIRLYREGTSTLGISDKLGVPYATIRLWTKQIKQEIKNGKAARSRLMNPFFLMAGIKDEVK